MTLGELFSFKGFLEKVIQLGWFRTPTNSSPSLLFELGIEWIVVYDGFWIKITSNEYWVSKIVLTIKLFFYMFWEKILISLIIMKNYYSQLNELTAFFSYKFFDILSSAISYWINASRIDICLSLLNVPLCSSNT